MRKIIFFIILILLFQGFVNVRTFSHRRGPEYNVLNLELLPLENDAFEIKEETLTLDLRGMKEGTDSHAELLAEYRLVNPGTARKSQFALPFIAADYGAESFSPGEILVNGNEAEATLYISGFLADPWGYIHKHPTNIDFYKEFAEAVPEDFRLPEINGSLYTFTGFPDHNQAILDIEVTEGTRIIYDYGVGEVDEEKIRLSFSTYSETKYKVFVIGEIKNVKSNFITEYEKTEMILDEFFEECFSAQKPLEKLIAHYYTNKFLASSEICAKRFDLYPNDYYRLWFYVFEADLLGDNATNTIQISYHLEGFNNDVYSPDIYEFRYFTSPINYWKTYEKMKIRLIPGALTKYLLKN